MALPCLLSSSLRRLLAAALTSTLAAVTGPVALAAEPAAGGEHRAYGEGEFLGGSVAGVDLAALVELEPAFAQNHGSPPTATSTAKLNLVLLEAIAVHLGNTLKLAPGNGFVSLGAANQFAQAAPDGRARAASGAVNDNGAIALGATDDWPADATVNLHGLIGDELAAPLADLRLTSGAIAATAEQPSTGSPMGEYQLAALRLELESAVVAGLTGAINQAVGTVEDAVQGLAGPDGALAQALGTVGLLAGIVGSDGIAISIETDLRGAVQQLLQQPVGDGVVELDLGTGAITIDLAPLVDGLNDLPVATEVLSADVLAEIAERIGRLLDDLAGELVSTVLDRLHAAWLTVEVDATALGTGVKLDLTGSLSDVLGGSVNGGEVSLVVLGGQTPLVRSPALLSLLTAPVNAVLFDEGGAVETLGATLSHSLSGVVGGLAPIFDVLRSVLSVRVNVQERLADGAFTQRALQVTTPVAQLNLASATVGQLAAADEPCGDPCPTQSPSPAPDPSSEPTQPPNPGPSDRGRELFAEVAVKAIEHGELQTLTAWGFDPGEEVRAEVHVPVWHLPGTRVANADGEVVFQFLIPDGFPADGHTAFAVSVDQEDWAWDTFDVVVRGEVGNPGLPLTGTAVLGLALLGLGLAGAGGAVAHGVRRRRLAT